MNKIFSKNHLQKASLLMRKHNDNNLNHTVAQYLYTISTNNIVNILLPNSILREIPKRYCTTEYQVPRSAFELWNKMEETPKMVENSKLLKVAIIGTPNSGKSTLINVLCGSQVCGVSRCVHTTTYNARAIMTVDNVQVIFIDTPGAVFRKEAEKYHLNQTQLVDPLRAVLDVDLIAILHDVSQEKCKSEVLSRRVIKLLACNPLTPSILILNKIDKLDDRLRAAEALIKLTGGKVGGQEIYSTNIVKQKTDDEIRMSALERYLNKSEGVKKETPFQEKELTDWNDEEVYSGKLKLNEKQAATFARRHDSWPLFRQTFCISASKQLDTCVLKQYLIDQAYPKEWIFPSNVLSDQSPHDLALNILRGVVLEKMPSFMSYFVEISISHSEVKNDILVMKVYFNFDRKCRIKSFEGYKDKIIYIAETLMSNTFNSRVKLLIIPICK